MEKYISWVAILKKEVLQDILLRKGGVSDIYVFDPIQNKSYKIGDLPYRISSSSAVTIDMNFSCFIMVLNHIFL